MDEQRRAEVAERAARAAAEVAREGFRTAPDVETKGGKTDVVTQYDRDAQDRVLEVLGEAVPDEPVVGEEEGIPDEVPEEGPAWVVDPIDGTSNYVRDVPLWCSSVAAVVDGEPVAAANVLPAVGDVYVAGPEGLRRNGEAVTVSERSDPGTFKVAPTFWWGTDRRDEYARATRAIVERFGDLQRYGSAQVTFSFCAAGGLEGVLSNVRPNPWDSVAGAFMVRQAGGTVTDLAGDRWRHDSEGLVASNGRRHDEVLAAAREIDG